MNKDYVNKDALKRQINKDPRPESQKQNPDKSKPSVPPQAQQNQQSKNR